MLPKFERQKHKDLERSLYAYKSKKKPSAPKAKTAVSPFAGVETFNVGLDGISNSTSTIDRATGQQNTTGSLSPALMRTFDMSNTGLQNNLNYLNQTPVDQFNELKAGNNPFFNEQKIYMDRALDQNLGKITSQMGQRGLENSTLRGSLSGQVAGDSAMREAALTQQALAYQNQQALASGAFNQSNVLGLPQLAWQPTQMGNQNLFEAQGMNAQIAMFNAQQQQQAAQLKYQAEMQQAQQRSQMWGQLAGAGIGALGMFATGGLGSALGGTGALGGFAGGLGTAAGGPSSFLTQGLGANSLGRMTTGLGSSPFLGSFAGL